MGAEIGAKWLKEGARLLRELCPECGSPLFDRRGEIWCPRCNKRLFTVEERFIASRMSQTAILARIEETINNTLMRVENALKGEREPTRLRELCWSMFLLLRNLEVIRRLRKGR